MIGHNWDYIDRLLEEPRAALAQRIRETCPLILSPSFYVNRLDECRQFHEDLVKKWNYDKPSERLYTALTEWIHERERDMTHDLSKDLDWGEAGVMETVMPQGMDFEHAHFHEIVFHAFSQGHIYGTWLSNLHEYLGDQAVERLFQTLPGLHLLAPTGSRADGWIGPMVRKLCHSDICALLKLIDTPRERLALFALLDVNE